MNSKKITLANNIYLILAGLFITSLVASNLIFTKIFYWYPFDINLLGVKLFELSVGILPYPLTFLITDLISEIYGRKESRSGCNNWNICINFFNYSNISYLAKYLL